MPPKRDNDEPDFAQMDQTDRAIYEYIDRNYPGLRKGRLSVGRLGDHYRIIVTDRAHWMHTVNAHVSLRDDLPPKPAITVPVNQKAGPPKLDRNDPVKETKLKRAREAKERVKSPEKSRGRDDGRGR